MEVVAADLVGLQVLATAQDAGSGRTLRPGEDVPTSHLDHGVYRDRQEDPKKPERYMLAVEVTMIEGSGTAGSRRHLWTFLAGLVLVVALGGCVGIFDDDDEAVAAVQAWVAARNAGDVDTVLRLTADDATLLGHPLDLPHRRDDFVELLRAQVAAGFEISETDCLVDDELVSCRYRLHDVFLRGLGIALTGDHEYVVRDGLIISARRNHDPEALSSVTSGMNDFRRWVKVHYPDLEAVIWTTRGSTGYSTVEGVQAMQSIFEEYLDSG